MTPKEKAREIFNEMFNVNDPLHKYPMCFDTAKQCALIAVDEILSYIDRINKIIPQDLLAGRWQEVKSEIEKL